VYSYGMVCYEVMARKVRKIAEISPRYCVLVRGGVLRGDGAKGENKFAEISPRCAADRRARPTTCLIWQPPA